MCQKVVQSFQRWCYIQSFKKEKLPMVWLTFKAVMYGGLLHTVS